MITILKRTITNNNDKISHSKLKLLKPKVFGGERSFKELRILCEIWNNVLVWIRLVWMTKSISSWVMLSCYGD